MTARRSSAILLFAALQFVVLTAIAMQLYPGYRFTVDAFSHLGMTRTWQGLSNQASAIVFMVAVASLGVAVVVFAAAWRDYAFGRGRARGAGIASQLCGTLSGLAFIGVAFAPMDLVLDLHNALVIAAFALLLGFSTCMTIVWWRNGAPLGVIMAGVLYGAVLATFFATAGWVISTDIAANFRVLVVAQKIAVYASLAYVVFVTLTIRRRT